MISLIDKLKKSAQIVNENCQNARNKMKRKYDKRNLYHKIQEGSNVMLWWPYYKKGIPRSF